MKIYHYHYQTKEYLGEGTADKNPVNPSKFLIPAFSTTIQPPTAGENEKIIFIGDGWKIEDIPIPPPLPLPTKQQKILELNTWYSEQKQKLSVQLAYNTNYLKDTTKIASTNSQIDALNEDYKTKLGVIMNG